MNIQHKTHLTPPPPLVAKPDPFVDDPVRTSPSPSETSAEHLLSGTSSENNPLAWGLNTAAESIEQLSKVAADAINMTGAIASLGVMATGGLVKAALSPLRVNIPVPSEVQGGITSTSNVTKMGRDLVENTLGVVTDVGSTLGNVAAQTVKNTAYLIRGSAILGDQASSNSPTVDAAQRLAGKSIKSFGTVLEAMNEAAKNTLETTGKTAVDVIETQFGKDAGSIAGAGVSIGNDLFHTTQRVQDVTNPDKIWRSFGKAAGKGAVAGLTEPEKTSLSKTEVTATAVVVEETPAEPHIMVPLAMDNKGFVKVVTV